MRVLTRRSFDGRGGGRAGEALSTRARRALRDARRARSTTGASILVLSDRGVDASTRADPEPARDRARCTTRSSARASAMRVGHRRRDRARRARSRDVALLIGYGAGAVNPYLAFETIASSSQSSTTLDAASATKNYVKALEQGPPQGDEQDGHLRASRATTARRSSRPIGIGHERRSSAYFPGTASRIGGIGLAEIAREALRAPRATAFGARPRIATRTLDVGGVYAWRATGERHLWTPADGRGAAEGGAPRGREVVRRSTRSLINDQGERAVHAARAAGTSCPAAPPVPLDEVEPAATIVRRFATGAMSLREHRARRRTRTSRSR